jgi:hypothetical protein
MPKFDPEALLGLLSTYTVGFALPDGRGHHKFIGSGTLVEIAGVPGILTASHVLQVIPGGGHALIALFRNRDAGDFARLNLNHTVRVRLDVPDVAFLSLPPDFVSTLRGIKTFKPLETDIVETYDLPQLCALLGVPDEWTTTGKSSRGELRRFTLLTTISEISGVGDKDGFDVVTITPGLDAGIDEPQSYGGVSGGGVWLCFVSKDATQDVDRRLMGVACREVIRRGIPTRIECCGPRTIYNDLINAVRARFDSRDGANGPTGTSA